jgi:hypothetical protein
MDDLSAIAADLPNVSKAQTKTKLDSAPPATGPLCPDWILSNNSNVHTAVDRGWFTSYTPFKTHLVDSVFDGPPTPVHGIGNVTIQALKDKVDKGTQSQRTITLTNVLHTPGSICNILGRPFLVESKGEMSYGDGILSEPNGSVIVQFESTRQQSPQLPGIPQMAGLLRLKPCTGPNMTFAESKVAEPNTAYVIRATWPDSERAKYENHCKAAIAAAKLPATHATAASTASAASAAPVATASAPPLNAEEKDWLKHKSGFGDEFQFLRAHGLSIYKEEDREEGRRIIRAFKVRDDGEEDEEEEKDEEGEDEEWDPTGHQADYAFTHEELEFMENGWGTSENFLFSYGLKFYNDEDLEEGKAIARAMMVNEC